MKERGEAKGGGARNNDSKTRWNVMWEVWEKNEI